jgi:lipid-A-disaccharide synthase
MRIFFSAGEPSGDLHGANLIRALKRRRPEIDCVGYGGERMEQAGCRLLYPLCQLAVMGFVRVFAAAHKFVWLLNRTRRYLCEERPDVVVLIDFPGFNWWVARIAHGQGIPVVYFVPPQIWGWARWRVNKMRRYVDCVLCSLPFEQDWYQAGGVPARYVGHPFFDELPAQTLDASFRSGQGARQGKIIGLLPGSRTQEVHHNLPTLVSAACLVHAGRGDTHFLVACFKKSHLHYVQKYLSDRKLPFIEPCLNKTPEIIEQAHACAAVSGSVGLELLYRTKPTVIVYRYQWYHVPVVAVLKKVKYISIVNLLADAELFPEFLTVHSPARAVSRHLLQWLDDEACHADLRARLRDLRNRVGTPGACERAADFLVDLVSPEVRRASA